MTTRTVSDIRVGDKIIITDAEGCEHESQALSTVREQVGGNPIIIVSRPLKDGRHEPWPWPAEWVRPINET